MDLKKRVSAFAAAVMMMLGCSAQAFSAEALQEAEVYREFYAEKTVSTVKASEKPGIYEENLYVKLSCSTRDARIFYTTDGSIPDIHSEEYDGDPIRIKGKAGETVEVTICAVAVKTGYNDSEIAEFEYVVEIPAELEVSYMEIDTEPRKLRYEKGEALDLSGGFIVVTYEDDTHKDIPMTESMISGFNTNTAGEKILTVTYAEFTDTFTIEVRFPEQPTTGGTSGKDDDEEADKACIADTDIVGWDAIEDALYGKSKELTVIIDTNGCVSVPAEVIMALKERDLTVVFRLDDTTEWTIDADKVSGEAVPQIGLGVRKDAIYIPDVAINEVGGTEAKLVHINSDNRLSASLSLYVDPQHRGEYASLYRYDAQNVSLVLVDTAKIGSDGKTELIPDLRGDYVVIADSVTRVKGDINNTMSVTAADASMLLRLLVTDGTDDPRADFNGDGYITAADVSAILMSLVA